MNSVISYFQILTNKSNILHLKLGHTFLKQHPMTNYDK